MPVQQRGRSRATAGAAVGVSSNRGGRPVAATLHVPPSRRPVTAAGGRSAERLLGVVEEVCAMVAELDAELLAPPAEARRLVVTIAEIARLATAELGEPVGARLHAGPGIVLQRELAASARVLDRAVRLRAGDCEQRLVARAQTTRALLRDVLTADG